MPDTFSERKAGASETEGKETYPRSGTLRYHGHSNQLGHKPMFKINFVNAEGDPVVTVASTKDNDWDAHLEGLVLLDDGTISAADFNVEALAVDGSPPLP